MKKILTFVVACLSTIVFSQTQQTESAILVISGGGSRGAYGVGLCEAIQREYGFSFDHIVGTSTGALMAPFILTNRYPELREIYRNVSTRDILKGSVFKKNGKFKAIKALKLASRKKELSGSRRLRAIISKNLSDHLYHDIQQSGKSFEVSTVGLETGAVRYRSSDDWGYEDMVDWIWASANQPIFMTPVHRKDVPYVSYRSNPCQKVDKKTALEHEIEISKTSEIGNGIYEYEMSSKQHYVDGGIMENVPIKRGVELAIQKNIKNIVVVVNNRAPHQVYQTPTVNEMYDKIFAKYTTAELVNIFSSDSEMNELDGRSYVDFLVEKMKSTGSRYVRMNSKVELSTLDVENLLRYPNRAGTHNSTLFNKRNRFKIDRTIDVLLATIDVFSKEVRMNDLESGLRAAGNNQINFYIFFMPLSLYEKHYSSLQFSPALMRQSMDVGASFKRTGSQGKNASEYFEYKHDPKQFVAQTRRNMLIEQALNMQDLDKIESWLGETVEEYKVEYQKNNVSGNGTIQN